MRQVVTLFLVCSVVGSVGANEYTRGVNFVTNPGFETDAVWDACGDGFEIDDTVAHWGRRSMRCTNAALTDTRGARQVITFEPPIQHPFRVAGWARAENAVLGQDFDIYLDLHYADGTPLWGQIAAFKPGTHDWQYSEHIFDVAKPVKTIEVHVLFRKAQGTVWFDDIEVTLAPFKFKSVRLAPGLFGAGSLGVFASTSMPASWDVTFTGPEGLLGEGFGDQTPVQFLWRTKAEGFKPGRECEYRVTVLATDGLLGQTIRAERVVNFQPAPTPRPYAVWTESSMRRVLPHSLPRCDYQTPRVHVALAGNEYESFQVAVLPAPDRPLRDVRVEASDLVCAKSGACIPARHIQWHQVGYIEAANLPLHPVNPDAAPGWWPDPLLPVEGFDVEPGFVQPIWVTVYAPANTPAGDYVGSLTLRPRDLPATTVPIRATVYGFDLPVKGHMKTAFALMDGFLERTLGKPLTPGTRQQYGDFVLAHRLNPDDISRTAPPALEDLLHYRDRGLNTFNVLNMVQERGDRTWVCWSPKEVYTPEFKQHLIERLDPYVASLRDRSLADMAYIYTFDERGEEFYPIIREYFGMVKERYPEIHTLTTAKVAQTPEAMRDLNVDWNCPLTSVYNLEQADGCRAAGLEVWAYICCGPRYPYANWMFEFPLIEARVIWWQAYHQKMDGLLYWGVNIWDREGNETPIDPKDGPLVKWKTSWAAFYGDGELVYAGIDGPIGSIRLVNIRDGLEDYEYLWRLAEVLGDVDAARKVCPPVTSSMTHFTRNPDLLYRQRDAIARQIETGTK